MAAIFVYKPFRVEKQRVENAERRPSASLKEKIFVKDLDKLFERMSDVSLHKALESFDNEISRM
ncbi:MAG: hypothetical protein H0Z19_08240 [Archaeoglobus sp.]|uniref:hypothetical protein n=1 Tax=Archaeoglobus sp. TaxID=1872626 RepID=UPI001DACB828|nr:hypothetical protein [Archaeoglobus sp.]MBO8180451.1 hypothetical protein [Archaeoglobus sp.]